MESTPGLNGSSGVVLHERVRALEVMATERQDQFEQWVDQLDERLEEGSARMDELGAASMRMETTLRDLTGLPERVSKIEQAVAPLATLAGMAGRLRNQAYYLLATGLGYLLLTGKITPEQAVQLARQLFGS